MKRVYTTAQGKQVSMDSLRLANEDTIAVGNMKVNARGDQLGPGGIPERSRQSNVNEYYNLHTPIAGAAESNNPGNGVIHNRQQAAQVSRAAVPDPVPQEPVVESADPLIDEQDQINVQAEPATQQRMRGNLADAVAKKAVVNQELMKPMKQQVKDRGPSRI